MAECPWIERREARDIARLLAERKRMEGEPRPIEELVRLFGFDELLEADEVAGGRPARAAGSNP